MSTGQRMPPRFVPTLTEVVPDLLVTAEALPSLDVHAGVPSPQRPDESRIRGIPAAPEARIALSQLDADAMARADRIEGQLMHRVLQRVELSLEERLSDAVSAAVQVQLDSMLPQLRTEIETVLRTLVAEALAHELRTDGQPGE